MLVYYHRCYEWICSIFNELEVLSSMNNKFAIYYMTRDTYDIAVLYSRCP